MKYLVILLLFITNLFFAQENYFGKFFSDQTMRIDYFHIGDANSETVTIDFIYQYGIWAGSTKNLLDNFNNGAYYYKVYDTSSGELLYSKGFDSYFKEYQTSEEAINGMKRTYHESAIIPYPKKPIKFVIAKRNKEYKFDEIFSVKIDPADLYIIKDVIKDHEVEIYKSHFSGDPHSKVDVVILSEGYTFDEKEKYEKDLKRYTEVFLNHEPFKTNGDKFNIYGIYKPSEESLCDEPGANIYRNTVLNSTFYSLGSERYLLTEDNKTLRDLAANVPYDAIYIMVNNPRYGGGGIYNFYCTFVTDNQFSEYIFLHEFGHSFGGLADEYYTSETAYSDFYPAGIEPVEPNITRLLDPENVKWKNSLNHDIEIPTPWEKENYDKMDLAWQKERRALNKHIAELKRKKAPQKEIEAVQDEYNHKDFIHSSEVDNYLQSSKYWNNVGVYEGAGYSANGMYRSMIDCLMFSKGNKPFCKVCEKAVKSVIEFYCE